MRILCRLFLVIGIAPALYSQTSAYQDADGNTSVYLRDPNASLTFNVSDTKFTVGYLAEINQIRKDRLVESAAAEPDDAKRKVIEDEIHVLDGKMKNTKLGRSEIGAHFFGKPTTDLTGQILQSSSSPASVGGGMYYGIHRLGAKSLEAQAAEKKNCLLDPHNCHAYHLRDDWFTLNVTYAKSTFDTVPNSSTTLTVQHFNGFSFTPSYSQEWNLGGLTFMGSASGGVNRTNNTDNLKKVEISTTEATGGSTSVVSQKDAYLGAYKESVGVPIYSDFVFIPKTLNWLTFDAFERSNVAASVRYAEGGLGVFIAKAGKPAEVLGGVSVGWKDGKSIVAVVAGWTF